MASVSNDTTVAQFKRVYGDVTNLLPEDFPLAKLIPFSEKQKVGEAYYECVVLTNESGFTLGGSALEAFELNPAIAGVVKQTSVSAYMTVLPSILPWGMVSRSQGSDKAFFDSSKFIVKNNLRSHSRLHEILRLYGQATYRLGRVSYATATYRGSSFTTGTGTVNGVTFTNGVNTTTKQILLAPGDFAAGIWVGMEGVKVKQIITSSGAVGAGASGKLVAVNAKYGYITVDFTPVVASSTTSHYLAFDGMEDSKEYIGINKILSTTSGSLFGITNTNYSLFQPNYVTLSNEKFTLAKFQSAVADMVNKSGFEGDLDVFVNPRTWAGMATTEAGLRVYDESYKSGEAVNGFESITFYTQAGKATIRPHRVVKEGEAYCLAASTWSRSGSAEVSFSVPGMPGELIFPLENQAGWCFRSFSDQYIFCQQPSFNLLVDGINDEAAS